MNRELTRKKEKIEGYLSRIRNHVFVTEDELQRIDSITLQLNNSSTQTDPAKALQEIDSIVESIYSALLARESAPEEKAKELQTFGVGLDELDVVVQT